MAKSGLMTKRIPTLLGLLILIGGLIAGIALVNMRQGIESKAGPTESPKNIKVSNKNSSSFSVSWTTDIPLTGFVKYSNDPTKINLPAGDTRDQISGTSQSYTNHHVNITGLTAGQTYYFLIGSGSQTYDDSGKPFQIRTGPSLVAPTEDVVFGKVVDGSGNPANGAVVYVEAEGGESLSTMTKSDGAWRVNLANSRDKDGQILTYDPNTTLLSIFVQSGSAGTATAITDVGHAKPVADIVLGKNQSFVEGTTVPVVEPTPTEETQATEEDEAENSGAVRTGGFQIEQAASVTPEASVSAAKILNPAIEGEVIATSSPQFKGTGTANTTVKVTVVSPEYSAVVRVDANGIWTWTAPQKLSAGAHALTLEYTDSSNTVKKLTRSFIILSAVDSAGIPAFTATPSATVTMTPTPTEIVIMPATESAELEDAGALSTTIFLIMGGIFLALFGRFSRRWTH